MTENSISAQASDEPMRAAPHGCHCDLEEGQEPDGCVIDQNRRQDCVYAGRHKRKEQCEYWQPIVVAATPRATADVERDAARFRMCVELCHDTSNKHGNFTGVMLPSLECDFRTTDEHFVAAIDAALAATKGAKP